MLDEFPALGRLDFFETALAFMAGYGIRAYLIAQSLNQISKAYGENNAILDNCHVRIAFSSNDERTAKRISDALGTATELHAQRNYAGHRLSPWLGHLMVSRQETARPLLTPGEVMQLPPADELVLVSGLAPIRAKKLRYYEDRNFLRRVEATPDLSAQFYRDRPPRGATIGAGGSAAFMPSCSTTKAAGSKSLARRRRRRPATPTRTVGTIAGIQRRPGRRSHFNGRRRSGFRQSHDERGRARARHEQWRSATSTHTRSVAGVLSDEAATEPLFGAGAVGRAGPLPPRNPARQNPPSSPMRSKPISNGAAPRRWTKHSGIRLDKIRPDQLGRHRAQSARRDREPGALHPLSFLGAAADAREGSGKPLHAHWRRNASNPSSNRLAAVWPAAKAWPTTLFARETEQRARSMSVVHPIASERRRSMLRTAMGAEIATAMADPAVIEVMVNPDGALRLDRLGEGRTDTGVRLNPRPKSNASSGWSHRISGLRSMATTPSSAPNCRNPASASKGYSRLSPMRRAFRSASPRPGSTHWPTMSVTA